MKLDGVPLQDMGYSVHCPPADGVAICNMRRGGPRAKGNRFIPLQLILICDQFLREIASAVSFNLNVAFYT